MLSWTGLTESSRYRDLAGRSLEPYLIGAAPYLAEFLGTFFVTLTFGFNLLCGDPTWMPTSVGFAVMVTMYATSEVSGGHLNPVISLAFGLSRKMAWSRVCGYLFAQCLAGMVGAVFTDGLSIKGTQVSVKPKDGFDWLDVGVCELVYSGMFAFVALNCMACKHAHAPGERNQHFALAVGFVAITGGYACYNISGAFFNPALCLGYSLLGESGVKEDVSELEWAGIYITIQVIGAVAATLLFFMTRPEELEALGVSGEGLGCGRALGVVCPGCFGREGRQESELAPTKDSALEEAMRESDEGPRSPWPARLLSEFIGTYVIVLTYGLSTACVVLAKEAELTTPVPLEAVQNATLQNATQVTFRSQGQASISTVAWATGAAVLSMVYALGSASGGHFNPAVTLAVALSGRGICSMAEGLTIVVMQGAAAITAALTYTCVHKGNIMTKVTELGPHTGYGWNTVALCEACFTMAVTLVYLCMLTVRSQRYGKRTGLRSFQFGLGIGLCVTAGGIALENISGGTLNPAVTLGHEAGNFFSSGFALGNRHRTTLIYTLWQAVGGLCATILFAFIHPLEYKEDPLLAD